MQKDMHATVDIPRFLFDAWRSGREITCGIAWDIYRDRHTIIKNIRIYRELTGGRCVIYTGEKIDGIKSSLQRICSDPALRMMEDLYSGDINCAVRGSISSRDILNAIKIVYKVRDPGRSLFFDIAGDHLFLSPVGIDELKAPEDKIDNIIKVATVTEKMGKTPRILVLGPGRVGDEDRDSKIADGMRQARKILQSIKNRGMDAEGGDICIERLRYQDFTHVVAPDGVSGNLIFRTSVFLFNAQAYGAPALNLPDVYVDTSREKRDAFRAMIMAHFLASMRDNHEHAVYRS